MPLVPDSPIVSFTILLLVSLTIPPIFERLKLPGLVGLLLAGVLLGPDGWHLLSADTETMELLSEIGKIYLMFVIGLEIDLEQFQQYKYRSLGLGSLTSLIPVLFGLLLGGLFNLDWNSSLLLGALFAPHTLIGYPIVYHLGVVGNEAVTISIGSTIFADIAALLLVAICVSIHSGEFSFFVLFAEIVKLAIYSGVILFGFRWAGQIYFRHTDDREGNQFLFILLALFLAAVEAQIIHVELIIGAFLAGLAVNELLGEGPVKEKVEFFGSVVFIPFFFVNIGLVLRISALIDSVTSGFWLTVAIVAAVIISKLIPAVIVKRLYGYNWAEALTIWSLTIPHVAATLAGAFIGLKIGLISEPLFNSVIVLMLVTSMVGPLLTDRFAVSLPLPAPDLQVQKSSIWWETKANLAGELELATSTEQFRVLVPVTNPKTQRYLIEISALIAHHESGLIVPLAVTKACLHMDEPELAINLEKSQKLLQQAQATAEEFQVVAKPKLRIYDQVSLAITRTAREQNANLIVMEYPPKQGLRARLFGNLIEQVLWSAHCPVAIMRLLVEPVSIRRILVPIKNFSPQTLRTVKFAKLLAETNQGEVTLLHVCPSQTPAENKDLFKSQCLEIVEEWYSQLPYRVKILAHDEVAQAILRIAKLSDLVILRSIRRRTAGGLAVSNVTTEVVSALNCSLILLGEPHS